MQAKPKPIERTVAYWLFVAGVFTMPMLVIRFGSTTLSDVLFLLAMLVSLPHLHRLPLPKSAAVGAYFIAVGGIIATLNSQDPSDSVAVVARVVFLALPLLLLTTRLAVSRRAVDGILAALLIGAVTTGAAAALQVGAGVVIPNGEIFYGRASGLGTHPNGQGAYLAVAFAVAMSCLLERRIRKIAVVALVSCVVGLLLAGSVSGMLAAGIGAAVGISRTKVTPRKAFSALAAAAAIWWLFTSSGSLFPDGVSPMDRFLDTTGQGQGESTLDIRIRTMEYAWDQVWPNPFTLGAGLGTIDGWTFERDLLTHNLILLVWWQGGVLVLAGMASYLIGAVRRARALGAADRSIMLGACAAAFAASMTGPLLYERYFWLPFLLAYALGSHTVVDEVQGAEADEQVEHEEHPLAR